MIEHINSLNWEFYVALFAIITSVFSIYTQRAHNKLTFKPIPLVLKYNYNNRIKILLWNKGTGPLFIKSFKVEDKTNLIDFVPIETRQLTYVDFVSNLNGRVISPTDSLNLLEFKIREDDSGNTIEGYEEALKKIKKSLDGVYISIEYTNIYKNKLFYKSEKFDFGNLVNEDHSVRKIKETLAERENKLKQNPEKKSSPFKKFFIFKRN